MVREHNIPLFLWIATAALVHLMSGGGADRAAQFLQERMDVRRFADAVRRHVRLSSQPLEVFVENEPAKQAEPEEPEGVPSETEPDEQTERPPESPTAATRDPKKKDQQPDDPEVEPTEVAKPEEEKKPEEKPKEKEKEPREIPTLQLKNRIAVVQNVEDKEQEDNPDAEFIGEQANRVKEQTQARITATDQNDPSPSPGSAHQGPSSDPGNSHVTDIAHSEDTPGEIDRAPNEKAGGKKATASNAAVKGGGSQTARTTKLEPQKGNPSGSAAGKKESDDRGRPQREQQAVAASKAVEPAPEVLQSPNGTDRVPEARAGQPQRQAQAAQRKRLPPKKGERGPMDFLGLGAQGRTRGGLNLNLSHGDAIAAVGRDQLQRERTADGERRRSKHRGSWMNMGLERWRAAIENYNSTVKPGNQTALNTARVPFASYLNQIHNRLHPIFADSFLASLGSLPREHPLNRPDMITNLEIVLDQEQGKVVKMGVTRASGSTVFDIAALESVQSASPFGKPPSEIISPDGNVYLHWEFHRNPYYACSTYFARPFMLKAKPDSAPPTIEPPPTGPFGPKEEAVPREGRRILPLEEPNPDQYAAR